MKNLILLTLLVIFQITDAQIRGGSGPELNGDEELGINVNINQKINEKNLKLSQEKFEKLSLKIESLIKVIAADLNHTAKNQIKIESLYQVYFLLVLEDSTASKLLVERECHYAKDKNLYIPSTEIAKSIKDVFNDKNILDYIQFIGDLKKEQAIEMQSFVLSIANRKPIDEK